MFAELSKPDAKQDAGAERQFSFPHEVVDDPSLNDSQKRSILSEWASDACAIPSFPTLRLLPGTTFPVTYSAVMDALTQLDRRARSRQADGASSLDRNALTPFKRRESCSPA